MAIEEGSDVNETHEVYSASGKQLLWLQAVSWSPNKGRVKCCRQHSNHILSFVMSMYIK